MKRTMLKSKLHRASVTEANLEYEGSITLDPGLCDKANIREFEKVEIFNCNNGARFATYVILGKEGDVCLNGAAARMVQPKDRVIIVTYSDYDEEELKNYAPTVLLLDHENKIKGTCK